MIKKTEKSAFGLVELVIVVMWLGIFAVIAVPRLNQAALLRHKAEKNALKIVADLRLTRRLAISNAANNSKGFELKMMGSAPYTSYEIENIDNHSTIAMHTLDSGVSVNCPTGIRFIYGPLGNLETGSGTAITVSSEGRSFSITVVPATGSIKCSEN